MAEHVWRAWREDRWPHQWIAMCNGCRRGTRCNSEARCIEFMEGEHAKAGIAERRSLAE